jgi:hypothetical protein
MGLVITAERPELKIPGPHKAKIEGTCRLRSRGVAFRAVALIVANLVKAGLMQNMYFGKGHAPRLLYPFNGSQGEQFSKKPKVFERNSSNL